MGKIIRGWQRFCRSEDGATAIEYAFLVALISIGLIAALTLVGESVQEPFEGAAAALEEAIE